MSTYQGPKIDLPEGIEFEQSNPIGVLDDQVVFVESTESVALDEASQRRFEKTVKHFGLAEPSPRDIEINSVYGAHVNDQQVTLPILRGPDHVLKASEAIPPILVTEKQQYDHIWHEDQGLDAPGCPLCAQLRRQREAAEDAKKPKRAPSQFGWRVVGKQETPDEPQELQHNHRGKHNLIYSCDACRLTRSEQYNHKFAKTIAARKKRKNQ